jgi:glycosyltransferase involved in cell wall biosynthesis
VWRRLLDADLVLASTPDLLAELPPGSVHLPNPIDVDLFTPVDGGAEGDGILVFARLNDVKGAPTIIEAVRRLRVEHPDVGIRAFAGGSYDAEAGRAGVTLLQPGDRACVLRELRAASVVIGQQRLGQLGLSELEAMACARAVVVRLDVDATDDPPPVARVDGVDTIVDACATLLADPDGRRALGAAARRFVVERHGSETIAQRLDKLYRGVL